MKDKIRELVEAYEVTQEMLTKTDNLIIELSEAYMAGQITDEELNRIIPDDYSFLATVIVNSDVRPVDEALGFLPL